MENKMIWVSYIGRGQNPDTPDYRKGACSTWGQEIEYIKVITIEKAKEIMVEAEKEANSRFGYEHKFYKMRADMGNGKEITYNKEKNVLTVWQDDIPIYQNCNGVICRDAVALADCIL